MPARRAVEHLAGLQAQAPLAPYVGLWTRLAGFAPKNLEDLYAERAVVRAHVMRNTVHLVTAEDFVSFRPLFQPKIDRDLAGNFGRNLAGADLDEIRQAARALLAERPLTRAELAAELAPGWPGHDPRSLAYAATHLLQLVQVPPRGSWGRSGPAAWFLATAWLTGLDLTPPDPVVTVRELVLRYLAAYGPASVNDIQAWSGLSRLREVTTRLEGKLRAFTGPDGNPLLDLPDAPRPGPGVPAPPRFLPEYDNLLLSFADRSRVIPHGRPVPLPPGNGATSGTLLVDGQWQAVWKMTRAGDKAVLRVQPFRRLSAGEIDAISAEGEALLAFVSPGAVARDVQFDRVTPDRSA